MKYKVYRQIFIALIIFFSLKYFFFYSESQEKVDKSIIRTYITQIPKIVRKNKFVRYTCHSYCGGFADRLKGIVGAYIWSRLTDRGFEIDVQHPCLLQNVLEPNEIDWRMEKNSMIEERRRDLTQIEIATIDNQIFRKHLSQINILELHAEVDTIIIRNNLDWVLHFSQNMLLQERIKELGFDVSKFKFAFIFKDIYRSLFKLSPKLMSRYVDFVQRAKINDKTKLICVQIREYYAKRENSMLFWEFVQKQFLSQNNFEYKIFISTDMPNVHQEGLNFFGKNNCVTFDGEFKHIDRGETNLNDCQSIEKVILDFNAFQNCDYAVISDSGFGKLGVYNRDKPDENLYVFKNRKNEKEFKKMSMQDLIEFDKFF